MTRLIAASARERELRKLLGEALAFWLPRRPETREFRERARRAIVRERAEP